MPVAFRNARCLGVLNMAYPSIDGRTAASIKRNHLRWGRWRFFRGLRSGRPPRPFWSGGRRCGHCRGRSRPRRPLPGHRFLICPCFRVQLRRSERQLQNSAGLQPVRGLQVIQGDDRGFRDIELGRNGIEGLASLYDNVYLVLRSGRSGYSRRRNRCLVVCASSQEQAVADQCCRP